MNTFTFFIIFVPILAILLLLINLIFAPHFPYLEKISVFECGFHSFTSQNRTPFNIVYFLFGLLFLIFDIEILLIYPYSVSAYITDASGLILVLLIMVLLTLGLVYELGKNALTIDSKQSLDSIESSTSKDSEQSLNFSALSTLSKDTEKSLNFSALSTSSVDNLNFKFKPFNTIGKRNFSTTSILLLDNPNNDNTESLNSVSEPNNSVSEPNNSTLQDNDSNSETSDNSSNMSLDNPNSIRENVEDKEFDVDHYNEMNDHLENIREAASKLDNNEQVTEQDRETWENVKEHCFDTYQEDKSRVENIDREIQDNVNRIDELEQEIEDDEMEAEELEENMILDQEMEDFNEDSDNDDSDASGASGNTSASDSTSRPNSGSDSFRDIQDSTDFDFASADIKFESFDNIYILINMIPEYISVFLYQILELTGLFF